MVVEEGARGPGVCRVGSAITLDELDDTETFWATFTGGGGGGGGPGAEKGGINGLFVKKGKIGGCPIGFGFRGGATSPGAWFIPPYTGGKPGKV